MSDESIKNHAAFIWSVADLLRGDYKQSEYGRVILPLTVLRRIDCVIDPVKQEMLAKYESTKASGIENHGPVLDRLTDTPGVWNTSQYDMAKLLDDTDHLAANLRAYIAGFSPQIRDILGHFELDTQIAKLDRSNLLYQVLGKFADLDLHPDVVSNLEMGYLYEELIRRFSELSNETAGEHFTPREVIRLMVNLLFIEDDDLLAKPGIVKTMFDPACGTGGMLSVAEDHLRQLNPQAKLEVFGQELNPETYATCRSDMMLKGRSAENIAFGNSFSEDGHKGATFDYLLANPPFGVEWKKVKDEVVAEHETKGFAGRFGAGLPRINDGSFLFLQHMISKMKRPEDGGSRLAIVFNGSPLFTGAAGSGESEIRRWIIENDWLEAVVALPDQLFYNTGISTYFWIVTNRKSPKRKGKVQLIDARDMFVKMRKSLGEKRKEVGQGDIDEIVRTYGEFTETVADPSDESKQVGCKIFPNEAFGFLRITVERPLRLRWEFTVEGIEALKADKKFAKLDESQQAALLADLESAIGAYYKFDDDFRAETMASMAKAGVKGKPLENAIVDAFAIRDPDADIVTDKNGDAQPDSELRDNENVPLPEGSVHYEPDPTERLATDTYVKAVEDYVESEVHPYVPDAWVDHHKTKIGYEVPLTRHFYVYTPPRPLAEIDAEIRQLETEIQALLAEVTND
ncbi:MAG: class I SAM-dependent DNA methyltransferase [Acidimicrobiales bacterium]